MQTLYKEIASEARQLGASKVVLYGSRARGDHRERSDIDIAVFGLMECQRIPFMEMIEALPTLLDFDVTFVNEHTDAALLTNIEKDGIVIMNKFDEKYGKFENAVARLDEAIAAYRIAQSDVIRDGVIQRFEFCTELAWKTLREYLLEQGYCEVNSPKAVMRQAYTDGILTDDNEWIALLNDRNSTSHIYDDATALQIFSRIQNTYLALFQDLAAYFKHERYTPEESC